MSFLKERWPLDRFDGLNVTVMGLGLFGGGRGVAEFLCRRGARVTVTDLRDASVLEPAIAPLRRFPIRWVLGEHRERDFVDTDLLVVSPAITRSAPLIELARSRRVPLETEMNLFFKYCPARICGITGSNGKTTTSHLTAAMAEVVWPRTQLGGNVGRSLLPDLDRLRADDWVVLELSSFQLEDLAGLERRPEVALVTNLSPNHLDRHGTYEAYLAAKREILRSSPGEDGIAVLNADDPISREWGARGSESATTRRIAWVGTASGLAQVPEATHEWMRVEIDPVSREARALSSPARTLLATGDLALPGVFNLQNASMAAAAAIGMGVPDEAVGNGARGFRGVAHRLERVAVEGGVEFYNDSIATTPESTIAALEALGPQVVLICGGARKGCSFETLGRVIVERTSALILIGTTAQEIEAAVRAATSESRVPIFHAGTLEAAVKLARQLARSDDRVILSPACPSYDQFLHFEERGDRFRALVLGS